MRVTVRAHPGVKQPFIRTIAPHEYEVAVRERPEKGRANDAIRKTLAHHLDIAPSRLALIMGELSKTKVFEIQ